MPHVEHIIDAINVFDITVVVVVPAGWPSLIVSEPIAAVLEAVIPAYHLGTAHVERVATAEMGTVMVVRNAAIMPAATVVSNRLLPLLALHLLCALRLRLALCLLCALWLRLALCLLGALWLRLALCRLGALWLRLALCLLCVLWLRLELCLLCTLRLRLALCLLCALWLRLVLRRLGALRLGLVLRLRGFSSAPALFLLFLCECRKGGCEK